MPAGLRPGQSQSGGAGGRSAGRAEPGGGAWELRLAAADAVPGASFLLANGGEARGVGPPVSPSSTAPRRRMAPAARGRHDAQPRRLPVSQPDCLTDS